MQIHLDSSIEAPDGSAGYPSDSEMHYRVEERKDTREENKD